MIDRYTPVRVQGLDSVIAISAGIDHSLALNSNGTVLAWGHILLANSAMEQRQTVILHPVQGSSPEAPEWPEGDVLTVTDFWGRPEETF